MLFQSACHVAQRYKESESGRKVLVIDFSLYSEVSSLLMGGQRPQEDKLSNLFGRAMVLKHEMAKQKCTSCGCR